MRSPVILLLDDNEVLRESLQEALQDRNFQVEAAADPESAREILRRVPDGPDVCVLDMFLENSSLTGAQFGIEIREQLTEWPTEFLIYSAYDDTVYIKQALKLGAATFLRKGLRDLTDVIRHIRVLVLRRALALARPGFLEMIDLIAIESRNRVEAISRFWRDLVCPELEVTVGVPFIVLHTFKGETRRLGGATSLPEASTLYSNIQEVLDVMVSRNEPLVIDSNLLNLLKERSDNFAPLLLQSFNGAAFLSINQYDESRFSIGFLQEDLDDSPLAENAYEVAKLIGEFIKPLLIRHAATILQREWRKVYQMQRALLSTVSRFCLYIGQEQISLFDKAFLSQGVQADMWTPEISKIRALGEELRAAGELLGEIASLAEEPPPRQFLQAAVLVLEVWEDILIDFPYIRRELLTVEGDCLIWAKPGDLYNAVCKLLLWLAQRASLTSEDTDAALRVVCLSTSTGPEISFEDRSRRLPQADRKDLFSLSPGLTEKDFGELSKRGAFLSLYLSKALIEMENGGFLDDRSDELEGVIGHRFVIRLPEPHVVPGHS